MIATTNSTTEATGLLTPAEAARWLAISERTLWRITAPRGPLACVRIGANSVRYARPDLEDYVGRVRTTGKQLDSGTDRRDTAPGDRSADHERTARP